jgi:hypothetical protein
LAKGRIALGVAFLAHRHRRGNRGLGSVLRAAQEADFLLAIPHSRCLQNAIRGDPLNFAEAVGERGVGCGRQEADVDADACIIESGVGDRLAERVDR